MEKENFCSLKWKMGIAGLISHNISYAQFSGFPVFTQLHGYTWEPRICVGCTHTVCHLVHCIFYVQFQTNYQFLVEYFGEGSHPGVGCFYSGPYVDFRHGIIIHVLLFFFFFFYVQKTNVMQ